MQREYKEKCQKEKKKFYKNIVTQAKEANPNSWYRLLKRITNYDQGKREELQIEEISNFTAKEQVELIANAFNAPSQMYKPLEEGDINIPPFDPKEIPQYNPSQIHDFIKGIKTNKSTISGDIPAKILKRFSGFFCHPLTDMINASLRSGTWPARYKHEVITPVPKATPTETLEQLRPISNLPICDKIFERVISEMVIEDMKKNIDPK